MTELPNDDHFNVIIALVHWFKGDNEENDYQLINLKGTTI